MKTGEVKVDYFAFSEQSLNLTYFKFRGKFYVKVKVVTWQRHDQLLNP